MIKVKVYPPDGEGKTQSSISLAIRRNLNGDYMIFDHIDMDIIVKPSQSKVVTLAKSDAPNTDIVYDSQNRLFQFLIKKGIVDPSTVEGGDLYGTIEGNFFESAEKPNATQATIFSIGKWMEEERPFMIFRQAQEEQEMDYFSEPPDEYTTDLGDVPHSTQKGTIYPNDFPSGANYRVYQEHISKEIKELFESYTKKGT